MRTSQGSGIAVASLLVLSVASAAAAPSPEQWRRERRLIDLHQHINYTTQHLARDVRIMDAVGLGIGVNLSGGTTTRRTNDAPSEFERNKALADGLYPGRFLHYMNLDYKGWNEPDFSARAVKQVEEGRRLGAAGLKEYKRLGLYLRDGEGKLIKIDDPKLDPVWKRCGELNMPVSIHVADPRAFWLPYDRANERWTELKDHRSWWFGDTNIYPPRMALLEALNRVIERHPKTTFVCVHFANNAEEIDWVDKMLDRYPNMNADLAARIPEIGRHPPERVRQLFLKQQDRIFLATDFQVYDRLTLGSGGSGPAPTDADAETFYAKHWRWLETNDRDFDHMTPIQGDWKISGIGLPSDVLRKIYFDNSRKLLARSFPAPTARAKRIANDFELDGTLSNGQWNEAEPVHLEYESPTYRARPEISTSIRLLWSDQWLYLGYDCPCTELTVFDPPQQKERIGLWDRDVVEAFIGSDTNNIRRYTEYEVAPTNEKLDLQLDLPNHVFEWSSGFESKTATNQGRWTCEMRIPLKALGESKPVAGTQWRINFYRCDRAHKAFLAWSPTLVGSFHAPEKFGALQFTE
jgi:predicted TIM-barrel fold metal-dependent hydrolase